MTVMHVTLERDKLLALAEPERTFLLSLGHLANELNATTKLLNWAATAPSATEAEGHGQFTLMLMLIRLLAGSLSEGWQFYQMSFFGAALSKTYEPRLDAESAAALASLKRYFRSRNAAHAIRNSFAFHYSPSEVSAALPSADKHLHAYLERSSVPNNLFHFSEEVLAQALLSLVQSEYKTLSLDQLVGEFFDVARWFSQVSDALMAEIIAAHGQELRAHDPEPAQFQNLEPFGEIAIPWFSDTSHVTPPNSGSA